MEDIALFLLRALLGGFFILARGRWLYDPLRAEHWCNKARHQHLRQKMVICGFPPWMAGPVATIEIFGGFALVTGLFTQLAALAIVAVLVGATHCTWREKIERQNPEDKLEYWTDYLWTVEPLYIAMAIVLVLQGAGAWSLDAALGVPFVGW